MSKLSSFARAIGSIMGGQPQENTSGWRDDSLDDWREERKREHEAERSARAAGQQPSDETTVTGSDEKVRTTERIGG